MKFQFTKSFLVEGFNPEDNFTASILSYYDISVDIDEDLVTVDGEESDLDEMYGHFINFPDGEEYSDYEVDY